MHSKLFTTLLFFIISVSTYSQKVERTYHDPIGERIKEEYQVNSNGVKSGYYKKYWTDGSIEVTGQYTDGNKEGKWTTYEIKGRVLSIENYSNGKYNGIYKQWCIDGGIGTDGKYYLCNETTYKDGKEVTVNKFHSNGNKWVVIVPDGTCNTWYEGGQKKSEWKNESGSVVPNTAISWYENGQLRSETKNGKQYDYEESGQISRVLYDSLQYRVKQVYCEFKSGSFSEYYPCQISIIDTTKENFNLGRGFYIEIQMGMSGNKLQLNSIDTSIVEMYNGVSVEKKKLKSTTIYDEMGKPTQTTDHLNKIMIGYYPNGNIAGVNDNKNHLYREYYEDGSLKIVAQKDPYSDKLCCEYTEYSNSGSVSMFKEYDKSNGFIMAVSLNSDSTISSVESYIDSKNLQDDEANEYYCTYKSSYWVSQLGTKQSEFKNKSASNEVLGFIGIKELNSIGMKFKDATNFKDKVGYFRDYHERADFLIELANDDDSRQAYLKKVNSDTLNSIQTYDTEIRNLNTEKPDKKIFPKYEIVYDYLNSKLSTGSEEDKYLVSVRIINFQNVIAELYKTKDKEIMGVLKSNDEPESILKALNI